MSGRHYTQDELLAVRPEGARIEGTDDNAFTLAALATDLHAIYVDAGGDDDYDIDEDKLASLWCFDPEDTFGGFDQDVARIGCDEDGMREIVQGVFELLPSDAQQQLRELDVWGIV